MLKIGFIYFSYLSPSIPYLTYFSPFFLSFPPSRGCSFLLCCGGRGSPFLLCCGGVEVHPFLRKKNRKKERTLFFKIMLWGGHQLLCYNVFYLGLIFFSTIFHKPLFWTLFHICFIQNSSHVITQFHHDTRGFHFLLQSILFLLQKPLNIISYLKISLNKILCY